MQILLARVMFLLFAFLILHRLWGNLCRDFPRSTCSISLVVRRLWRRMPHQGGLVLHLDMSPYDEYFGTSLCSVASSTQRALSFLIPISRTSCRLVLPSPAAFTRRSGCTIADAGASATRAFVLRGCKRWQRAISRSPDVFNTRSCNKSIMKYI